MGFMRAWSPPVAVGLVVAVLAIGVAEVSGVPAPGTPVAMEGSTRAVSRPTSVAPAAIEREDLASPRPALVNPRVTPRPRPIATRSPAERPAPTVQPRPLPRPSIKPIASPIAQPTPDQKRTPPPLPAPPPPAPPPPPPPSAEPPLHRVTPIVRPRPAPVRPADALDLRRWKLTLPAGRSGHPLEFRQPVLGSLANGSYFRLRLDRGVAFRSPVGGVTTPNSSYPRSELREMSADGRREAGWTNATGRHEMTITQAITATPRVKPHVVAGQIHDAEDDIAMIRLEGRRLFVEADGDDVGLLDPHYRLGRRFTVSIVATRGGVRVTYGDARSVHVPKVGRGWYFKAGCYPQSNPERGDRPTDYGEVVIYSLTVRHS